MEAFKIDPNSATVNAIINYITLYRNKRYVKLCILVTVKMPNM